MTRPTSTDSASLLLHTLHTSLHSCLDPVALRWLEESAAVVADDTPALAALFPVARRRCGGAPLTGWWGWSRADGARTVLLSSTALDGPELADAVVRLYRGGDPGERCGVLRALPFLPLGDRALPVVDDALRTNDTRLISAALGPYARARLDQQRWRQAVLKCLFTGIPLACVAGLDERRDTELADMGRMFVKERQAAGRSVPDDVWLIVRPC
ncbi:EboA domain-containing protein [Streptomyces sp. NPDC050549]|uniref:EboA domain-containing protein n=1 Tax=Streptomyces sp. NPDC050549 TaxID=3155406 RepID=UPI00343C8375